MTNNQLIDLLESEMRKSILEINVESKDEGKIDLKRVNQWYIETEKTVRVIDSVLITTSYPAINQLRYAGHHILKANLLDDDVARERNLVEAYKHCKRAYFDALDSYKLCLGQLYKNICPYLISTEQIKIERTIRDHLIQIDQERLKYKDRISFYDSIQSMLIDGLRLIEQLNQTQRESESMHLFLDEHKDVFTENVQLKNDIANLNSENRSLEAKINGSGFIFSIVLAISIGLGTFLGLWADAFMTSNLKVEVVTDESLYNQKVDSLTHEEMDDADSKLEVGAESVYD